jgi:isocitrate lyase
MVFPIRRLPVLRPLPRILSTTPTPGATFSLVRMYSSRSLHVAPSPEEEDAIFEAEVQEVKGWWKTPRFAGIKRPYTAVDIVSKRGMLKQEYPSSTTAKKLFGLLKERAAAGEPVHTSMLPTISMYCSRKVLTTRSWSIVGAIDPVQMTQQAPHQEVLYVSGWACSSVLTSTNEVSPDLGDYPYNTVPNQVQRLFKAQQLHDRRHWDARRSLTPEQRKKTPWIDYLRPIIADGDTGHGGLSAVMKLAKLFAENGAAAIHLEDQLHGGKKVPIALLYIYICFHILISIYSVDIYPAKY